MRRLVGATATVTLVCTAAVAAGAFASPSGGRPLPDPSSLTWAPGSLAFTGVHGGTYVVDPVRGTWRRLVRVGIGGSSLRWSPDGKTLLLANDGKIFAVRAGRLRTVVSLGFYPAWAPDGKRIAYGGLGGFYVARADGSHAVRIVRSDTQDVAPTIVWAPDGHHLAYVACKGRADSAPCADNYGYDLYVVRDDGTAKRRVTRKSGLPMCPTWSARGPLAFEEPGASSDKVVVASASGSLRVLGPGGCPSWSPDGGRLVFPLGFDLVVMHADGSGRHVLHVRSPNGSGPQFPVWRPDGKQIAFTVGTELFTIDADGSSQHRVL